MTPLEVYQSLQDEDYYPALVKNSLSCYYRKSTIKVRSVFDVFIWEQSPQGSHYWDNLHCAWCKAHPWEGLYTLSISDCIDALESLYPKSEYPEFYL